MPECVELPPPVPLRRTAGWNLAEAFGPPTGGAVRAAQARHRIPLRASQRLTVICGFPGK
jgi:hypothetical protein